MVPFKRSKEEPPMTPDVKKEDQEYFEDVKVKKEPTEPHKR